MNIDYTAIIAKAEQRKNALKAIEALLEEAPHRLKQAKCVHDYTVRLKAAYAALDAEGRKMLPEDLNTAFNYVGGMEERSRSVIASVAGNVVRADLTVYASHAPNGA